jgi:antitoxin ParD1/3/4
MIVGGKVNCYTNPWYSEKDYRSMASRNTSISLGDHMLSFAQQQVATGRYSSTSDVVRAGLRLLEEHESRVQALREALIAGENSGPSAPFDFDSFITAKRARQPAG